MSRVWLKDIFQTEDSNSKSKSSIMDIDQELAKKIQELQILEQNLQGFLAQKQVMQVELNETNTGLKELNKASDSEIYKILSGIMIKAKKEELTKDLNEKKKTLELRVSSIEKQEKLIEERVKKLREEINEFITKSKK